jgi:ABC-type oligopeptide transport system ATPase subunit
MANLIELILDHEVSVGLVGKLCSGKTTFADYLVNKFGYKKCSFADELKHVFKLIYQIDLNKSKHRNILQNIGTIFRTPKISLTLEQEELLNSWKKVPEFMEYYVRNEQYIHNYDCWVNLLSVREDLQNEPKIVVDDCRYQNEVDYLKQAGFVIVKITCPEHERLKRITELYPETKIEQLIHPSEILLDKIEPHFELSVYLK